MAMTANLRAAALMAVSMACFVSNDALTKSLNGAINAGQIMAVRGGIMLVFLLLYVRLAKAPLPVRKAMTIPMALRVSGEVLGSAFFLVTLFHMPLANISAVLQALPLAVTLGAALVLREPVGIRRFIAIIVGFIGVVIIIRPGLSGFTIYSLYALSVVLFAATRDLATRLIDRDVPTLTVSLLTNTAVTVSGFALVPFMGGWEPMDLRTVAILGGASALLFVGYQSIVVAMRTGDIHIVAPFRYVSLLWSIILGMIFFGEWPDSLTILGSAIIVATGLYTLYRERVVTKRAASAIISSVSPPPARGT